MGQYKAQFISMIIMIALGFGVFVGANMEWVSIEKNTNRLFEETGLADYKIYSSSATTGGVTATFSENDLQRIKRTRRRERRRKILFPSTPTLPW